MGSTTEPTGNGSASARSTSLGAFRSALLSQLSEDLGIEFKSGLLVGPIEGRDLGSVYTDRIAEVSGRIQEDELLAVVRVFKAFEQQLDPQQPYDPAPLENLIDQLQASVKAHQTGISGVWFQRLTMATVDPVVQGVEATILGRALNAGLS